MAKIGIEVEGRFKGLKTLFIDDTEIDFVYENFNKLIHQYCFVSIYISNLSGKLNNEQQEIINYFSLNIVVLIETKRISYSTLNSSINFVLRIMDNNVFKLRDTDQIKFEKNLNVKMVTVENMSTTLSEDFSNDEEIVLK